MVHVTGLSPSPSVCRSVGLSVCLSVRKVYCGKWLIPFGVVSGIGRGMGVLNWDGDRRREGAVLGVNLGRSIVTNATRLFSRNYFEDLFLSRGGSAGGMFQAFS